jgi:hypothetical protein
VNSTVDYRAAFGTDQPGPARRVATLVRRLSGLVGLTGRVHGEELDGESNRAQRLDLVLDTGRDGLGYTRS